MLYMFFVIAAMSSLGIGAFILSILSTMEIKAYMNCFSEHAKNEKNQLKILQRLGEFVKFHSEVKQLSNNDLYLTDRSSTLSNSTQSGCSFFNFQHFATFCSGTTELHS